MRSETIPLADRPGRTLATTLVIAAALVVIFAIAMLVFRGHARAPLAIVQHLVEVKTKAAAGMDSPKLILLSGSGGLFGIRAKQLGERTGLPAVNFGLHGGLGTNYLMYLGLEAAKPGDVVLMAVEYPLLSSDWLVSEDAVFLSWARGDRYFSYLGWRNRLTYLRNLSAGFLGQMVQNAIEPPPLENWFWRLSMINDVGDMNPGMPTDAVLGELRNNIQRDAVAFARQKLPLPFDPASPPVAALADGIRAFKAKGVRVIAILPGSFHASPYSEAYAEMMADLPAFYRDHGAEFISVEDRGMLRKDDLFDTVFHTNDAASTRRTGMIAAAICAQTDVCRPTN